VNGIVHNQVRSGGQLRNLPLRFTDVYVKKGGRWQMVAWQSTIIPQ
jgi:hypothetical protein